VHLEIQIGNDRAQNLEVVYSRSFGDLPVDHLSAGAQVEACGDFINAKARAGSYAPSPMGAIIHWVHYNPGTRDGGKHEHGYTMIDGVVYGLTGGGDKSYERPYFFELPIQLPMPSFAFAQ
jgi:hypothetical protein